MERYIRQIIAILVLAMASLNTMAQANPFDKFADSKDITYVYISEAMLKLIGTEAIPSINGVDIDEISGKLKSIQIITSEKTTKESLKSEAMSIIKKEAYEKLLQISEPDNKVDIYFKDGKKNSIIVMVNGEKNQTVLIVFSGTFSTSSIAKIFQETK